MTNIHRDEAAAVRNIRKARAILHDWGGDPEKALRYLVAGNLITTPPQIIRTREELDALDPDTLTQPPQNGQGEWPRAISAESLQWAMRTWSCTILPAVVIATGEHVRAARQALEDTDATD